MDNNTNKKPSKTNMPKFNLNWLYMIIAMMLLGLYLTNESGTASKKHPPTTNFRNMYATAI